MKITTKRILICGATVLVCVMAYVLLMGLLNSLGIVRAKAKVAVYDGMVLIYCKESNTYSKLITPIGETDKLTNLYVKVGTSKPISIKKLTEASLDEEIWEKSGSMENDSDFFYDGNGATFYFKNGTLKSCIFFNSQEGWQGVAIGQSATGKFGTLPMTQEKMIEVFGEPISYDKSTIMAP